MEVRNKNQSWAWHKIIQNLLKIIQNNFDKTIANKMERPVAKEEILAAPLQASVLQLHMLVLTPAMSEKHLTEWANATKD